MWDSKAPLQLLSSMPKKLSKENLEKLQMVIDADKYKNSLLCGFDLCEMYAPFCRDCKKTGIYPCAIAYINMLRAGGADVEIDAKPVNPEVKPINTEPPARAEIKEQAEPEIAEEPVYEEAAVAEAVTQYEEVSDFAQEPPVDNAPVQAVENTVQPSKPLQSEPVKRKIRIAVARKKL